MDVIKLIEESDKDEKCMTVEATVATGFEFMAKDECKEKCQPSCLAKAKGRIFFNIPIDKFDKVKALRSVDNLYLVSATMVKLNFQNDKDKDLEVVKLLIERVDWNKCVKTWGELCGFEGRLFEEGEGDAGHKAMLKYRATCHRSGTHSFTSMDAARDFGGALQDKFNWTVDLTNFDLEVVLNIASDSAYVCAGLTKSSLHKRNISHFGATTLRSTMCYNLLRLAQPTVGDIFIDPLCGGASIPIEGCLGFKGTYHMCGDNDLKASKRAEGNINHLKLSEVDFLRWDSTHLPLRDNCMDAFVTDLPFGKRSGRKVDNKVLYKNVLAELARVVRRGTGRAVILTGDRNSFIKALETKKTLWRQMQVFGVNQGGLSCFVFFLIRTGQLFSQSTSQPPTRTNWRSAPQPVPKPTSEPTAEPTSEPETKSTSQPETEQTFELKSESLSELTIQSATEPTAESATEPKSESETKPMSQPETEQKS